MTATFAPRDIEEIFHALTYKNHKTYLGLPQLKAYDEINLYFQFRTLEPNGEPLMNVGKTFCRIDQIFSLTLDMSGLIMFNAGKGHDFLAVELVNGHINYILNLGYGATILKDSCPGPLNDNKWHTVHIARYCLIRRSINCRHNSHRLRLLISHAGRPNTSTTC